MLDAMNYIILAILTLLTIRDILTKNFAIPKRKKWSWIFYNRNELEKIPPCYRRYELSEKSANFTPRKIIEELLLLTQRHIKRFDQGLVHGRFQKGINSKYFINTLEASHNKYDLDIMATAITKLIQINQEIWNIDFVISLKSGNVILAKKIADDYDLIHICKENLEKTTQAVTLPNSDERLESISLKYENFDKLVLKASTSIGKPLNGIIIDCSISTGHGIDDCVTSFNKLISDGILKNINPVKNVFVLHCHQDLSKNNPFQDKFNLHRFFDMNEQIREIIFETKDMGIIKVYDELKKQKLFMIES